MTPLLSSTILRAQSDRRLVALAQAGHEAAFTVIVERYRGQLRRYCARLVPESRADDALQSAFLLAWRALQDGRAVRELRPWLYAIVHNAAVSQVRRGVFDYVELLDTLQGSDETAADVEQRSLIRQTLAAVAALPERQRDALLAVALEGRPQAEVAVEMGLTDNGLRQLLFRARTTVRGAATAVTPIPVLTWLLRGPSPSGAGVRVAEAVAGAGAVAGGATVLPAGTALVVAGTLAVGGAVGLRTPAAHERAPAAATVAATPTSAPVAANVAHTAARRAGALVVRGARPVAGSRAARRPAHTVSLRGSHGLRVAVVMKPAIAPHPSAGPEFVSTEPIPAAAQPGATAAPTPSGAGPSTPAGDSAHATAPSSGDQPATAPADVVAAPRAQPDHGDGKDDGEQDSDRTDGGDDPSDAADETDD